MKIPKHIKRRFKIYINSKQVFGNKEQEATKKKLQ
jgi:hypothetical protein